MGRRRIGIFRVTVAVICATALLAPRIAGAQSGSAPVAALAGKLRAQRTSTSDLELSGDLTGVPHGESRYLTREDLLAVSLPMTISPNDGNFKSPSRVRAIRLDVLARELGAPVKDMTTASCKDKYSAHYPPAYVKTHHPVLVIELNGNALRESKADDYGPYMIAHVNFKPAFSFLSHADEPQIPWGVVRLDFRDPIQTFGAIQPRGGLATGSDIVSGYAIAAQNCFRCHNSGAEGGQKSGVTWTVLGAMAENSPIFFMEYVRDPQAKNPKTQMAASPAYDDATMRVLIAYFRTFAPAEAH